MTEQHPITPPPELVEQWKSEWLHLNNGDCGPNSRDNYVATQAARWGADCELDACCEWLGKDGWGASATCLRAARRLKLPSLKEQALRAHGRFMNNEHTTGDEMMSDFATIRRALEQLDD